MSWFGIQDAKIVHVNSWLKTGRLSGMADMCETKKTRWLVLWPIYFKVVVYSKTRLCKLSRRLSFLRRTFLHICCQTWQAANDHHGCTLISTAPRHHVATRALKIQINICVWSIHVKDFACNFLADWVDWWLLATNRKTSNWVNVSSSLFWQNLSLGQVSDVK